VNPPAKPMAAPIGVASVCASDGRLWGNPE